MDPKAPKAFLQRHYDGSLALFLYHVKSELHRQLPLEIRRFKKNTNVAPGTKISSQKMSQLRNNLKRQIKIRLLSVCDASITAKMIPEVQRISYAAAANKAKQLAAKELETAKVNIQRVKTLGDAIVESETEVARLQAELEETRRALQSANEKIAAQEQDLTTYRSKDLDVQKYRKFASDTSRERNSLRDQLKDLQKPVEKKSVSTSTQVTCHHKSVQTTCASQPPPAIASDHSAYTIQEIKNSLPDPSHNIWNKCKPHPSMNATVLEEFDFSCFSGEFNLEDLQNIEIYEDEVDADQTPQEMVDDNANLVTNSIIYQRQQKKLEEVVEINNKICDENEQLVKKSKSWF